MKPGPALLPVWLATLLTSVALWGVPKHLRESVQGDLLEQAAGPGAAWAIALHFQAEPYRDGLVRRAALLLALAAAGLLWTLPMAANALLAQATVFTDAFSRAALQLWGAPAVLAAVAGGLLVGRAALLPPHADAVRLHLILLLAPAAALAAPGAALAALAVVCMAAAAGVAHLNRLSAAAST
ncbi:MAG: hypothetical protein IV093_03395 [Rubrivivax sp.]|nr:hypothetical protein [Rubrivivax sp.]